MKNRRILLCVVMIMVNAKLIPDNLIHVYNDGLYRRMFRAMYVKLNISSILDDSVN